MRKYKYLNRPDCPRKECLYASENIKIDVDGELEKFALYPDPLDRIETQSIRYLMSRL